ncbi:class I histocompatibility antigen, F10 alpha chain isoform X4 [Oreochromis niloticus]|uniref:class I histocompatibility antigen, F10 alpha chain isoform X4 n=1 Tax=Oreochromis niloticus TaxID=8128 RepID=UPI000DF2EFC2|nr:class I histocompatibility antigen, F10 alpha chain isoform X4 [Oreochromis niloticus]
MNSVLILLLCCHVASPVLPKVSLLQKTPSSPVSCHATGFYPDRAVMFWRKDGVQLHEGVDPGEILPNNDGTFQMSIDLNVSSVTPEDWQRYDCVFQLAGVNEHIITKLDKTAIRTNWAEKPADMVTFISAAVVLLTVTIITAVAFVAYKKKKAPDDGSEQSERLNPQS